MTRPFWRPGVVLVTLLLAVVVVARSVDHPPPVARALRRLPIADAVAAAETGVREGIPLVSSSSLVVTVDGTVVEGLDVVGTIEVRADDVVIQDTRVSSRNPYLIRIERGATGTRVENVELDGLGSDNTVGIAGSDLTVRRADIHHVVDGIKAGSRSRYQENWIHDLSRAEGVHADGIQVQGARDVLIQQNLIDATGANSALIIKADTGLIANVQVERNLLLGGNYTLYVLGAAPDTTAQFTTSDVTVRANQFQGGYRYGHRQVAGVERFAYLRNSEVGG